MEKLQRLLLLLLPVFIILLVCWLALMKPHVLFISFPVFASSLGFRIVVNLISRGGGEEKTLKNLLCFPPSWISFPSLHLFFTALEHTVKYVRDWKYSLFFASHLNMIFIIKVVLDDMFSEIEACVDAFDISCNHT